MGWYLEPHFKCKNSLPVFFIVNQLKKPTQSSNVIFKQKWSDLNLIALGFYLFIVVCQNNWHFRSDQKGLHWYIEKEKSRIQIICHISTTTNQIKEQKTVEKSQMRSEKEFDLLLVVFWAIFTCCSVLSCQHSAKGHPGEEHRSSENSFSHFFTCGITRI